MSILTAPFFDIMSLDDLLASWLAPYNGEPGVFTIDPVPGDAKYPLIVSAGEVDQTPNDTKNCFGRSIMRDVRCYADADGSAIVVEKIAERVRLLFHRQPLVIPGYTWVLSNVTGPIKADEPDYYGRIVTVMVIVREIQSLS